MAAIIGSNNTRAQTQPKKKIGRMWELMDFRMKNGLNGRAKKNKSARRIIGLKFIIVSRNPLVFVVPPPMKIPRDSTAFRWKTFIRTAKVVACSILWTWLFSTFWPAIWIDITMKRSSTYFVKSVHFLSPFSFSRRNLYFVTQHFVRHIDFVNFLLFCSWHKCLVLGRYSKMYLKSGAHVYSDKPSPQNFREQHIHATLWSWSWFRQAIPRWTKHSSPIITGEQFNANLPQMASKHYRKPSERRQRKNFFSDSFCASNICHFFPVATCLHWI